MIKDIEYKKDFLSFFLRRKVRILFLKVNLEEKMKLTVSLIK